jgi:hypothetical protein
MAAEHMGENRPGLRWIALIWRLRFGATNQDSEGLLAMVDAHVSAMTAMAEAASLRRCRNGGMPPGAIPTCGWTIAKTYQTQPRAGRMSGAGFGGLAPTQVGGLELAETFFEKYHLCCLDGRCLSVAAGSIASSKSDGTSTVRR